MARTEEDREDLMREAVALPERAEFQVDSLETLVTVGFRATGAMSIFFGQDPVFQFDPDGRLRRAWVGGFLFRSQHSTLARLERVRTEQQTILNRTDLTAAELEGFRESMQAQLRNLLLAVSEGRFQVLRSVPEHSEWKIRVTVELTRILDANPWLSAQIRARR